MSDDHEKADESLFRAGFDALCDGQGLPLDYWLGKISLHDFLNSDRFSDIAKMRVMEAAHPWPKEPQ